MATIEIKITDKIARVKSNMTAAVNANSDYTVKFLFDSEWDAYAAKTARFRWNGQYEDVAFTGDECNMPTIYNASAVQIGVYAGDLHTTTPATVFLKKSILCGCPTHAEPTEDVYNQLMALLESDKIKGEQGEPGKDGTDGTDGYSPKATVTETDTGATITITDKSGTTTATVKNGQNGKDGKDGKDGEKGDAFTYEDFTPEQLAALKGEQGEPGKDGKDGTNGTNGRDGTNGTNGKDGADGYSPTATVTATSTGATVTITDKTGTTTAEIKNGTNGKDGTNGLDALRATKNYAATYTTIGCDASWSTDFFNRMPVVGDIFTNIDASSNTGTWKITSVSGGLAHFTLLSYVSSKGSDANVTKENVVSALGYTPLETAPVTSVNGKTGAVVVGTEESVCEGIVLPNMEYPEYAINTIILKQTLGLTTSDIYIDPITTLKNSVNSTIVWYSDIYTALADVNAGVVTNGSSTEISTGVKVMKIGDIKYSNAPANMFIVQLLADITLTETLNFDVECLLDLNGHAITYTYSTSMREAIMSGANAASPEFAFTIYGVKAGSAITCNGTSDITDDSAVLLIDCRNLYVSIIGGTYSVSSDTTPLYGDVIYAYPYTKTEDGKAKLIYKSSVFEAYFATVTASTFCNTAGYPMYGIMSKHESVRLEHCTIDVNQNSIASAVGVACDYYSSYITQPMNPSLIIKGCTITAYSKPNSSIQSAYAVFAGRRYTIVRNSTLHGANCGLSTAYGAYISDSVLEGGEHGGVYVSVAESYRYTYSGSSYVEDGSTLFDAEVSTAYIQNTTLRKLDGTGSPHNNLYSCYVRGGKVYFNNVTFDSYNGAYNRPSIAKDNYSPTEVYLSNCSMNGIRVDANCKAVLGAGIPDAIRTASVSGTIVNKPTEIYSAVISREIGGMSNRLHEGILKNKESIKALGTAEGISGALGYTPLSSADGSVQNAHLADSAVTTDKLAEAERMTSANITNALGYEPEKIEGTYELINTITVEEAVISLVIDKDSDGNALSLRHMFIEISTDERVTENKSMSCSVKGSGGADVYIYENAFRKYRVPQLLIAHSYGHRITHEFIQKSSSKSPEMYAKNEVLTESEETISALSCYSGAYIPAGTTFTVYGIRA